MKLYEKLKSENKPSLAALRKALGSVSAVQILSEKSVDNAFINAETLIELPDGTKWLILLEHLTRPEPRHLRRSFSAVKEEFQKRAEATGADHAYLTLTGPWFSEEAIRLCQENEVGCVDEQGNCLLSFGTIHIEITGRPNPHKRKSSRLDISKPKSARVVRTLLQHPHGEWKVLNLAAACEVSTGTVSRVRTRILEKEWAIESENGFVVTSPDALLDAWSKEDDWKKRTEMREYSLLDSDPIKVAETVQKGFIKLHSFCVFTQWFAGWLRAPYTVPPVVSAYVPSFPDDEELRELLGARRVNTGGGNLRLIVSTDLRGIVAGSRTIRDFPIVSDVQIYLDLLGQGLRSDEQAEELRKAEDFMGGWK